MSETVLLPPPVFSETCSSVLKKWADVVAKAGGYVQKSGVNSHHKYTYAQEKDILPRVVVELAGQGLVFATSLAKQWKDGDVIYVWMYCEIRCAETGEFFRVVIPGAGQDKQDKAVYKALTGMNKYYWLKMLLLATGDEPESETAKAQAEQSKKKESGQRERAVLSLVEKTKMPVASCEAYLDRHLESFSLKEAYERALADLNTASKKRITGKMRSALESGMPADEQVFYKSLGIVSLDQLTQGQFDEARALQAELRA